MFQATKKLLFYCLKSSLFSFPRFRLNTQQKTMGPFTLEVLNMNGG